jgi:hypothetical protein
MTKQEAQTLLDMAQQGLAIPAEVVTWALTVTGDAEQRRWSDHQEVMDFVQALRNEGLL